MEKEKLRKFLEWYLDDYENDSMDWPLPEEIVKRYLSRGQNSELITCPRCGVTHVCKKKEPAE